MIRIVFRSADQRLAWNACSQAAQILNTNLSKGILIMGPAECPVNKISRNFRYQILMKASSIVPLQSLARNLQTNYRLNPNVYAEYDVDPVNLL